MLPSSGWLKHHTNILLFPPQWIIHSSQNCSDLCLHEIAALPWCSLHSWHRLFLMQRAAQRNSESQNSQSPTPAVLQSWRINGIPIGKTVLERAGSALPPPFSTFFSLSSSFLWSPRECLDESPDEVVGRGAGSGGCSTRASRNLEGSLLAHTELRAQRISQARLPVGKHGS